MGTNFRAFATLVTNKRKPFFAASILIIGSIGALYLRNPKVLLEEVPLQFHAHKTIAVTIETQIRPAREEYLVLRKGGSLDAIRYQVGDEVPQGAIIALVNSGLHEARLRRALSQYRLASAEYARTSRLFQSATETRQSLDLATNTLNVARAEVEEAKKNVEDSLVRAPFAGVVSFISFKVGDYVPDGGRVAVIEDRSEYIIQGRVPKQFRKHFPYQGPIDLQTGVGAKIIKLDNITVSPESAEGFFAEDFDVVATLRQLPRELSSRQKVKASVPIINLVNVTQLPLAAIDRSEKNPRVLILTKGNVLMWHEVDLLATEGGSAFIQAPPAPINVVQTTKVAIHQIQIGKRIRPDLKRNEPKRL